MKDVIIVGGGMFGQTIAASLRRIGMAVEVIDANFAHAGSKPSACLTKPSWITKLMGKGKDADASLAELHDNFKVYQIELQVKMLKVSAYNGKFYWIDPRDMLGGPVTRGRVSQLLDDGVMLGEEKLDARHIVVAAGVWTANLVPINIEAKCGWAFYFPGQIKRPFHHAWGTNYRQVTALNIDDNHVWVGDTTALKIESLTDNRREQSARRCAEHIARQPEEARAVLGYRPDCSPAHPGDPCYLNKHGKIWVATGGAKLGTIGAGWCAYKLRQALT